MITLLLGIRILSEDCIILHHESFIYSSEIKWYFFYPKDLNFSGFLIKNFKIKSVLDSLLEKYINLSLISLVLFLVYNS